MVFIPLQILGILITVVVLGIIIFAYALIKASKKSVSQQDSLEGQIRQAISTARRIKFKAQSDINRLKMWANDAISVTYGQFIQDLPADQLLDNYEKIKQQYADKIDQTQVEKTDNIVYGYLGQIQIKQAEMETAEKTEQKYSQLLEQLKSAKIQDRKNQRLQRHEQKLEQMNKDLTAQKQLIEHDLSYDMLKQDVQQKLAYLQAMQELQQKYDTESFVQNADTYRKEMQNIVDNLN